VNLRSKKILYVNGCSHTAGAEIEGEEIGWNTPYNSRWCYGGQIAYKYKLEYVNDAKPGSSNDRIFRTTIDWISRYQGDTKDLFCIIGWATNRRLEFFYRDTWIQWVVNSDRRSFESFRKREFLNLHKYIVMYLTESKGCFIKKINQVISLSSLFTQYKIDYVMLHGNYEIQGGDYFKRYDVENLKKLFPFSNFYEPYSGFIRKYLLDKKYKKYFSKGMHAKKYLHTLYSKELDEYISSNINSFWE